MINNNSGLNLQKYILGQGVFNKTKFKVISTDVSIKTGVLEPASLMHDTQVNEDGEHLKSFEVRHLLRSTLTTDKYVYTFFMRLTAELEDTQRYSHCADIERLLLYPSFLLDKEIIENYPTSVRAINGNQELHDVVMWLADSGTPANFERCENSTLIFQPLNSVQDSVSSEEATKNGIESRPSRARRGLMNREIQMRYALTNHFNEILRSEEYAERRDSLLDAIFHASSAGVNSAHSKITEFMSGLA